MQNITQILFPLPLPHTHSTTMVWCCSWGSREVNCFTTWSTKDWLGVEDTGFNWTELQSDSAHTRWVCLQQRVAADPTDHKTHSTTPPSGCTLLLASLPSPTSSFTSLSPSQASVDKAKARTHTHTRLFLAYCIRKWPCRSACCWPYITISCLIH